jgi:hypothetical protein
METQAILALIAFSLQEAPQAINLVTSIVSSIQKQFVKPEDRVSALQAILTLLTPMEKVA